MSFGTTFTLFFILAFRKHQIFKIFVNLGHGLHVNTTENNEVLTLHFLGLHYFLWRINAAAVVKGLNALIVCVLLRPCCLLCDILKLNVLSCNRYGCLSTVRLYPGCWMASAVLYPGCTCGTITCLLRWCWWMWLYWQRMARRWFRMWRWCHFLAMPRGWRSWLGTSRSFIAFWHPACLYIRRGRLQELVFHSWSWNLQFLDISLKMKPNT